MAYTVGYRAARLSKNMKTLSFKVIYREQTLLLYIYLSNEVPDLYKVLHRKEIALQGLHCTGRNLVTTTLTKTYVLYRVEIQTFVKFLDWLLKVWIILIYKIFFFQYFKFEFLNSLSQLWNILDLYLPRFAKCWQVKSEGKKAFPTSNRHFLQLFSQRKSSNCTLKNCHDNTYVFFSFFSFSFNKANTYHTFLFFI